MPEQEIHIEPSQTEALTNEAQSNEAQSHEAQPKKSERNYCSLSIVDRYRKPTTLMTVILLLILNITMVIVGITVIFTSYCPIEVIIPIYLINAGAIGIAMRLLIIVKYFKRTQSVLLTRIMYGLIYAELIWLIIGSCWIFSNQEKKFACNRTAFNWAFFLIILNYIILLCPLIVPYWTEYYRYCFVGFNDQINDKEL